MTRDTTTHATAHGWLAGEGRPMLIPRTRLDTLRAIHAAFIDGLAVVDPEDDEALASLDVLAAELIDAVPDLLDAIEDLHEERDDGGRPRVRSFVKMDAMGGTA